MHSEAEKNIEPVPAIIPAFGSKDQLQKCIAHLQDQSIPIDIFVRDNSRDNVYFTAAVNEGIRQYLLKDCEYILLINQDMYLERMAVGEMVTFMDSHPKCGITSPLQLHPQLPDYVIWGGSYEVFPVGKHRHGSLAEFTHDQAVPWCNGSCMLLRKQMVHEIGLLDENFRFIGSDSDYCFTARARGWQVWMVVRARGVHEYGSSKAGTDPKLELLKANDMLYFARKWLTGDLYKTLTPEPQAYSPARIEQSIRELERLRDEWASEIPPAPPADPLVRQDVLMNGNDTPPFDN